MEVDLTQAVEDHTVPNQERVAQSPGQGPTIDDNDTKLNQLSNADNDNMLMTSVTVNTETATNKTSNNALRVEDVWKDRFKR